MEKLKDLINRIVHDKALIMGMISSRRHKDDKGPKRVSLRPVFIQGSEVLQFTYEYTTKETHRNLTGDAAVEEIQTLLTTMFNQANLYTTSHDYRILLSKKGRETIISGPPSKQKEPLQGHNRKKQYLLPEDEPCSFLIHLGIMNQEGRVLKQRYDKFRQINKFLELVQPCLSHLQDRRPLHIVDFGCGKSYLTFALYYYLVVEQGLDVRITGMDLKEDVVSFCNQTARDLGYGQLEFIHGDIQHYTASDQIDMVITLHACDTATDAALAQAVGWGTAVILSVPCCQHELFPQIDNPAMQPLLKHGILKERLSSLVTDAIRGSLLEEAGYAVQIMEFISTEHTPKNILIKAVKTTERQPSNKAEYLAFKEFWQVHPVLESSLDETRKP